jgi:hypothetical protein
MNKTVLFVSHREKECGIHQYGRMTAEILSRSKRYLFAYTEANSEQEFAQAIGFHGAANLAAIILNYGGTLGWVNETMLSRCPWPVAALAHDTCCPYPSCRWHIHIDPTFPECDGHFSVGRPVPKFAGVAKPPNRFTIGSFGFGFRDYVSLMRLVNDQFTTCKVRLHVPFAHFGDVDGLQARTRMDEVRKMAGPGVELEITHGFKDRPELLDWLASNSLNALIYGSNYGRGPASTLDMALAVPVPVALTRSYQFRHIPVMNNRVEWMSLKEIHDRWHKGWRWCHPWSHDLLRAQYERIVDVMVSA